MGFFMGRGLLVCLLLVVVAQANAFSVEPYPGARVIYQSQGDVEDYVLALGSYKKAAGSSWLPEREERLNGSLARYTLELPAGHTTERGYEFYLQQLPAPRELYHCLARDCGTSNSWANNHFRVLQLYGLDQFQQYGAYEVAADGAPAYVSIYAVQRGNRRVYMQVEVLQTRSAAGEGVATSPESIAKALLAQGYYVLPEVRVANNQLSIKPAHVQAVAELLALHPGWKLALVGHDYSPQSLAQQQNNAQAYAEQLRDAIDKAAGKKTDLVAYGLGSLAPAGRAGLSARLELVKLPN